MPVVNLGQKLDTFTDHWSPKIVSTFNGHDVMVVKVKGEFVQGYRICVLPNWARRRVRNVSFKAAR